jgi:hypothetical protein
MIPAIHDAVMVLLGVNVLCLVVFCAVMAYFWIMDRKNEKAPEVSPEGS